MNAADPQEKISIPSARNKDLVFDKGSSLDFSRDEEQNEAEERKSEISPSKQKSI